MRRAIVLLKILKDFDLIWFDLVFAMDVDFNGDVASLDADLLQLPEVSPLAIKANPYVAEKLFDQWFSLPDTAALVISSLLKFRNNFI